jgi:hypothetical protein
VLLGAWVGAWVARAIADWVLELDDVWVAVAVLVAASLGGLAALGDARKLTPMDPQERRDTILGWGALVGGVAAIACLFLPLPWGAVAALVVLAATVVALRWRSVERR